MGYCTWWFEGWWSHCCRVHDEHYAAQIAKELADQLLGRCVAESMPLLAQVYPWLADIAGFVSGVVAGVMVFGVSAFGDRFYRRAGKS